MKQEEFRKLFKNLYTANPTKWDKVLQAKKNYSGSKQSDNVYGKQNRQVISSEAFGKLVRLNQKQFEDFGKKQNATVNRPKSIRINNETLAQNRRENQRNRNAEATFVDSSAVDSFNMKDNHNGTKDVTIKFNGGNKEYLYPDVPTNVANGLYAAPSKGSYVQDVISGYSDISNPKVQAKIRKGN